MFSNAELIIALNPIITAVVVISLLMLKEKWVRPGKLYVTYVTQRKGGQPVYHHAVLDKKVDPLEWITNKDSKDKNIYYRIAYVQPVHSKVHLHMMKPADDGTGVWSMNNGRFENRLNKDYQRNPDTREQTYNREEFNKNNGYQQNRNFAYQNR